MSGSIMALQGSEQQPVSFDALYRASMSDVHAYAMSLLRDRTAAEDVTALAFERAYRKWSSYDARRGPARAWLFGIARNAALDELRKRKRTAALVIDPQDPVVHTDDDPVRRATVRVALAALEPRDRELISLKFHAGLTNVEIAKVLGVSQSVVGTRLHRVVNRLREACHAST